MTLSDGWRIAEELAALRRRVEEVAAQPVPDLDYRMREIAHEVLADHHHEVPAALPVESPVVIETEAHEETEELEEAVSELGEQIEALTETIEDAIESAAEEPGEMLEEGAREAVPPPIEESEPPHRENILTRRIFGGR